MQNPLRKGPVQFVTPEEFETILEIARTKIPEPVWFPLVLRVLFATGCRPAEVVGCKFDPGREPEEGGPRRSRVKAHHGIRAEDVLPNNRIFVAGKHTTPRGRTHDLKPRIVLCADTELHVELRTLADGTLVPHTNLFLPQSRNGVDALEARIQALRKHLPPRFKKFTSRWLRHSHAIAALRNGVDLVSVQRQLGHESLEITAIYLRFADLQEETYTRAFGHQRSMVNRSCPSCGFSWAENSLTGHLDLTSKIGVAMRRR